MSAELIATIIGTVVTIVSLGLTLGLTIYLTNRSTQKILDRIAHAIHEIAHVSEKIASHSAVDLGLQGVGIAEDIESREEAEKLGELIKYNPKLKVAYYRPKKSVTSK